MHVKKNRLVFLLISSLALISPDLWADRAALPIQGYVVDKETSEVLEGSFPVTFKLYSSCDDDSSIYKESQFVDFEDGLYSTSIEPSTAIISQYETLCLGIQIGADDEMTPRLEYYGLPYSHLAYSADTASTADVANVALSLSTDNLSDLVGNGLSSSSGVIALDTTSSQTWSGSQTYVSQVVVTKSPATTASSAAALRVNPTSASTNSKYFAIQDNGTDRFTVDKEGDVTIAGDLTVSGTINVASLGDITSVSAGDGLSGGGLTGDVTLSVDQTFAHTWSGQHTFQTDVDFGFSGTENLSLTSDLAGTVSVLSLIATPSSTNGTTAGILIRQDNSANPFGLDTALSIDNADTDLPLTTAIKIAGSSTGAITTAIDLSDAEIATALALGSNDITVGGITLSSLEMSYLDGVTSSVQEQLDAKTGDITGVTAGSGLTGGGDSGSVTLAVGAGNAITVNADDIAVTTNSINQDELAATITFADADFIDLASILHDDTALQGLRLPQIGAAPSNPVSGEGFVGWDESTNTLMVYNGASWSAVDTDSGGDITAVTAGSGLTGGGDSGAVTVTVGAGTGITVNDDDVAIDQSTAFSWTGQQSWTNTITDTGSIQDVNITLGNDADMDIVSGININATSAATGDLDTLYAINIGDVSSANIMVNEYAIGIGANWDAAFNLNGTLISSTELGYLDGVSSNIQTQLDAKGDGDITAVTAGSGLTGGGESGAVSLAVGAGNAITVNATTVAVTANSINEDELAALITFADADFIDLASILHDDTALQGLRLPQIGAAPSNPVSGEGFVGWDESTNTLMVYNGASWSSVDTDSGGDITTVTAGSGLTGGGDSGAVTVTVGAGTGITVNDDDVAIDQSTAFSWTGQQSWTNTVTAAGSIQDINITLGDDADTDIVSGLNIDATSAATGDADTLYGINIGDLISADGTVNEYAIGIGANWDAAFNLNGTLISSTELGYLDGVSSNIQTQLDAKGDGDITGVTAGDGLTGGGTSGAVTLDIGAGNGISAGADSVALDLDYAPTWTNAHSFSLSGTESIAITNSESSVTYGALSVFNTVADTKSNSALYISVTDNTTTSGSGKGITVAASGGSDGLLSGIEVAQADTDDNMGSAFRVTGNSSTTIDTGLSIGGVSNTITTGIYVGDGSTTMTTGIKVGGGIGEGIATALDLSDSVITTAINLGDNPIVINDGGSKTITVDELGLLDGATVFGDVTGVTAGDGLTGGGNSGALTVTVGPGTGITVNADDVAIDQSTAFTWTGQQSWTSTVAATGSVQDINITLGDDADTDIVSGLNIDATSAATGDADTLYGINIGALTSANGTVNEYAIGIGANWDAAFNLNGTLISSTELGYLDGVTSSIQTQLDAKGDGDITGVTAGSGLTGGGDSGALTMTVGTGTGITVNADDIAVNQDTAFAWTNSQSYTFGASEQLTIDASSTANTTTNGVINMDVAAGDAALTGFDLSLTQNDGATLGVDAVAQNITLTGNDADGDLFGIKITGAATINATAGTYEAGISIDNAEDTAGSMPDAILITSSGTSGGITDAIDASAVNITNADSSSFTTICIAYTEDAQ